MKSSLFVDSLLERANSRQHIFDRSALVNKVHHEHVVGVDLPSPKEDLGIHILTHTKGLKVCLLTLKEDPFVSNCILGCDSL